MERSGPDILTLLPKGVGLTKDVCVLENEHAFLLQSGRNHFKM